MTVMLLAASQAFAQPAARTEVRHRPGGEVNIHLPDLNQGDFLGMTGHQILLSGLVVCVLGLLFGAWTYTAVKNLPVHRSMADVSALIYETCKAYLIQQGKFLLILELFIGTVMVAYFWLTGLEASRIAIVIIFSLIGIAGSYGVAWYGIRINTLANSRTAFASLQGKAFPVCDIPLRAGMSVGMMLISVELLFMLAILLFIPGEYAGVCFLGFAIGESLGAAALRIAGGIFTKIADIGSDLMKVVFKIKEDDARNPGVIADCTGDNAGDSVGPTADGFETYGVTGVALITFIMLAVAEPATQVQLLVWIFMMRVMMVLASAGSYLVNNAIATGRYGAADEDELRGAAHLAGVADVDRLGRPHLRAVVPADSDARRQRRPVVAALQRHHLRHAGRRDHPGVREGVHLHALRARARGRHLVARRRRVAEHPVGPGRGQLQRLLARPHDHGPDVDGLRGVVVGSRQHHGGAGDLRVRPGGVRLPRHGPGDDRRRLVWSGHRQRAVGLRAVADRRHSRTSSRTCRSEFGFKVNFAVAKELLEENDGAGNTFKATAKPVLIGTAVVGATTMIFAIIMALTQGLVDQAAISKLSILHPPFLLGLITGGAVIYWFTGASMQAVTTGAYRAVEFIKANIKLEGSTKASVEDSKKVVEICTVYAQKGMFNIFLGVFFSTLAFAFIEPFFFIGYLISIALFGLYQAIFMANAGGAWDNAKKIVETELKMKGTPLHDASVVGDTVGDPFKDTSSVAMNPVIKFTTLFGLLAVELGVYLSAQWGAGLSTGLVGGLLRRGDGVRLAFVLRDADRGVKGWARCRSVEIQPSSRLRADRS